MAMNDLDDVEIGSAANFRQTLNTNFQNIEDNWPTMYVGNSQTDADAALAEGGIWLVTD